MKPLSDLAADWPAISGLLDEALALPPGERMVWLAARGGLSASQRDRLRSLLATPGAAETDNFLQSLPSVALAPDDVAAEGPQPGDTVGPWRLVRLLGEGGMGSVFLAERSDGSLKRPVALKLPRLTWARGLAERMARERDILATLEHPHIARLYDAGLDALGRPWLALEYVPGRPIDAYCRDRVLTVRQRVELLLQVCAAVAYAHNRLVVHRDLKPSNILVTTDEQVRLLDFGIAKLMEGGSAKETHVTQLAGRALTLDYASPEQIKGEPIGTASDVYSLGVVAYELLTGTRPYKLKRGSAAELEEAIAMADASKASEAVADTHLKKALRGDLDAILNKALKKHPAERYPTIDAFAADLQRHLSRLPVTARPDTFVYRARRFLIRRWLPVLASTGVAATASVGLGVSVYQARQARAQAAVAVKAAAREEAVKVLYVDALATVAGWDASKLAQPQAVAKLLRSKLADMESRLVDSPESLLAMQEAVSVQLPFMGDYEGSLAVGQRYLEQLVRVGAEQWRIQRAFLANGKALWNLGRLDESAATLQEGLKILPADDSAVHYAVRLHVELSKVMLRLGRRQDAIRAAEAAQRAAQNAPSSQVRLFEVLQMQSRLQLGYDNEKALDLAQKAHASFNSSKGVVQQVAERGASLWILGRTELAAGIPEAAEVSLRAAQRLYDEAFGAVDRDTVHIGTLLAAAMAHQDRFDEARALLASMREQVERRRGTDHAAALAAIATRLLNVELLQGRLQAAARAAELASQMKTGMQSQDEVLFLADSARLLAYTRRGEACLRLVDARLAALANRPAVPVEAMSLQFQRAECLVAQDRTAEAIAQLNDLVALLAREEADRTWQFSEAVELRAALSARTGATARASDDLEALDRHLAQRPERPPSRVAQGESLLRRAEVQQASGQAAQARELLAAARQILATQDTASPRVTVYR